MKIEILCDDLSMQSGYKVYNIQTNKPIENFKNNIFKFLWSEDQIFDLLGEINYKKFESGEYIFNVTKEDIYCASLNDSYFTKKCLNNYYLKKQ